jgi:hypothetical protein
MDDRYQHQPWPVRLWRCRWYLPLPWVTARMALCKEARTGWFSDGVEWQGWRSWVRVCWSIHKGLAQGKMKYWYNWEEVRERLGRAGVLLGKEEDP